MGRIVLVFFQFVFIQVMVLILVFPALTHPSQGLVQDPAPTHHPTPSLQGVDLIPHLGKINS